MEIELKEFQSFVNPGLGECYVIKKEKVKDRYIYLIYIKNNSEHFNITDTIYESFSWTNGEYRSTLDSAISCFNERVETLKNFYENN